MPRFRKKPVEVEAVQFTGDNIDSIRLLTGPTGFYGIDAEDRADDPEIVAEVYDMLHSTWVGVKVGNWIIQGVQGEFYPCAADVFETTYEPVAG